MAKNTVRKNTSLKKILIPVFLLVGVALTVFFAQKPQTVVQRAAENVSCTALSATDQQYLDSVVNRVMRNYSIPGLSMAVSKNGQIVYARGYGYANKSTREPVTTSTRFRTASLSKSVTATGIMLLVQSGQLNLDSKVFGPGSILGTVYSPRPRDPRINNITVRQLLLHTAGFWPSNGNDPVFKNSSYTQSQLIYWALNNLTLDSAPGNKYIYANFDYLILARVIEKVTNQKYEPWIQANVLAPSGISTMQITGNTLAQRAPNETVYYTQRGDVNAYSLNMSRGDGAVGWIGTATDILRFGLANDGFASPPDLLTSENMAIATTASPQSKTAGDPYGFGWGVDQYGWWNHGYLPGISATLVLRPGGYNWAILANTRDPQNKTVNALDSIMFEAIPKITSWPTCTSS